MRSASHARDVLEEKWCALFAAPMAVLTDRGSEFRAKLFSEFVTEKLGAYHAFTSPYYPQGNGINEASHKVLDSIISVTLRVEPQLVSAVRESVSVYNATPSGATGMSPFYFLFGQEPVFQGWQSFAPDVDLERRSAERLDAVLRNEVRGRMTKHTQPVSEDNPLKVGDWVVFPLGAYERGAATHPASSADAYKAVMSLPSKVVERAGNRVTVSVIGAPRSRRDVSASACRKLMSDVPPSLQPLALEVLEVEGPRVPIMMGVPRKRPRSCNVPWSELPALSGTRGVSVVSPGQGRSVRAEATEADSTQPRQEEELM